MSSGSYTYGGIVDGTNFLNKPTVTEPQQQSIASFNTSMTTSSATIPNVPNSPLSDTAIHPYSFAGSKQQLLTAQMQRRPLSVPPTSSGAGSDTTSEANKQQPFADMIITSTTSQQPQQQQQQFIMAQQQHLKMDCEQTEIHSSEAGNESVPTRADEMSRNFTTQTPTSMLNKMHTGPSDSSIQQHFRSANPASVSELTDSPFNSDHMNQSSSKIINRRLFGNEEQQQLLQAPRSAQQQLQQEEEMQQHQYELDNQRNREPIVLDSHALMKAMLPQNDEPSPLEQFLMGTTLLARLKSFFGLAEQETLSKERGKINLPIRDMHWSNQVLTVTFHSFVLPIIGSTCSPDSMSAQQQQQPNSIRMQLLVCPAKFRLINKLEFSGPNCPSELDVRIFERFFAQKVALMNNEMAVFAYINFCRLSSPLIFKAIAQLMFAQMEPHHYPWRIEIALLHSTDEPQQQSGNPPNPNSSSGSTTQKGFIGQSQKMIKYSIVVSNEEGISKQFLFCLCIRPNTKSSLLPKSDGKYPNGWHRFFLRYNVQRNDLCWFTPHNQETFTEIDQRIKNVLKNQSEKIQQTDTQSQQCCIWPCIQALLEGQIEHD